MTPTPTARRWLIASLVLNLFLVGAAAGAALRWWTAERTAPPAPAARGLRYAADDLSPAQRQTYLGGLREARRDAAAVIQATRDERQQVLTLMAAPQFDRAAVAAALARTRDTDMALRARIEASVVDFAATLNADERLRLTSGLARRSPLGGPAPAAPKP